MLLPALNKARDRGRSIACVNNLKQIGSAFSLYVSDHKDLFPRHYSYAAGGNSATRYIWSIDKDNTRLGKYLNVMNDVLPIGFVSKYGSRSRLACPGVAAGDVARVSTEGSASFYASAVGLVGQTTEKHMKLSRIKTPSRSMETMEWSVYLVVGWGNGYISDPVKYGRWHGLRMNILWIDGHIKPLERYQVPFNNSSWPGYISNGHRSIFYYPDWSQYGDICKY